MHFCDNPEWHRWQLPHESANEKVILCPGCASDNGWPLFCTTSATASWPRTLQATKQITVVLKIHADWEHRRQRVSIKNTALILELMLCKITHSIHTRKTGKVLYKQKTGEQQSRRTIRTKSLYSEHSDRTRSYARCMNALIVLIMVPAFSLPIHFLSVVAITLILFPSQLSLTHFYYANEVIVAVLPLVNLEIKYEFSEKNVRIFWFKVWFLWK